MTDATNPPKLTEIEADPIDVIRYDWTEREQYMYRIGYENGRAGAYAIPEAWIKGNAPPAGMSAMDCAIYFSLQKAVDSLLNAIHADSGEHTAKHGVAQSVEDALAIWKQSVQYIEDLSCREQERAAELLDHDGQSGGQKAG